MSLLRPFDKVNLHQALIEANKAISNDGCMPFGAVLADPDTGRIICRGHNLCPAASKRGGSTHSSVDVTRHAEMELIRNFALCDEITMSTSPENDPRKTCTVYSSTEPCVMCAGALYWSGISRIVYGCSAAQLESISGPGGFDIAIEKLYGMASPGARQIEVVGPLLVDEALDVHRQSGVWMKHGNSPADTTTESKPTQADLDIAVEASLLATGLGSAAVRNDGVVPIIDMSVGTDEEIAAKLWEAATQVGFFTLVNHGIDASVVDDAFEASAVFFAQPLEVKKEQSPVDMSINCGFEHFAQIRPSTGVADQKESIQVTARAGAMDGRWPSPEFQSKAEQLLEATHALAKRVLNLLEPKATPQVDPGTLANSHNLWSDDCQCTLRFLHYPPMEPETTAKLIEDGYWRAGPHTDWTNVTLLFQRMGQNGLECCANPRTGDPKEMYWTAVDPVPGGIAVNIGDMLARWSGGKVYSNLHRVRLPPDATKSRYSIAFFAQSDKRTMIENEGLEPITAGEYILSRIKSNFAK